LELTLNRVASIIIIACLLLYSIYFGNSIARAQEPEPESQVQRIPQPEPRPLTAEISSNATEGTAPATFEFEADITGGTEPYTIVWNFGDGDNAENIDDLEHTFDQAGTYNVVLTVRDSEDQTASDSIEIIVTAEEPNLLTAEIISSDTQGVVPATFQFRGDIEGGTEPYTYSWNFGDGSDEESNEQSVSHTFEDVRSYNVVLTVTDSEDQTASDSIEIIITEPTPELDSTEPRRSTEEQNKYSLYSIGFDAYMQGMYEQAMEYFDLALAIDPIFVDALNGKGAVLDRLGDYQDALEYFDLALAIDPIFVDALNNKGGVLGKLERIPEALEYTDIALAIDPNNTNALNNKGVALFDSERIPEALVYYDIALAIDPNNTNALNNKGVALTGVGEYEEAITYFDRALNNAPNNTNALNNKGAAIGNSGDHQGAIRYFENASSTQQSGISMLPTISNKNDASLRTIAEKDYYSTRNLLLQYSFNLDLQLDDLKGFNEMNVMYGLHYISHGYDIDVNKQTNSGIAKFYIGDYQGAILIFDEILRINVFHPGDIVKKPELAASLYNKGLCLEQQGNSTDAERYKNIARNIDPIYNGGYISEVEFSPPVVHLLISQPIQ
jgi:tetratricopeptide (TPR) repeat protein